MPKKIIVSIIGVTGYTGIELLRLLSLHPHIELKYLTSHSTSADSISDVWPHFKNICELPVTNASAAEVAVKSDVVFLALPHFEAQKIVPQIIGKTKIIDLSGDFRLQNLTHYTKYYHHEHEYTQGVPQFVYGLPELHKEKIAAAANIANPGCFAITTELALLPIRQFIAHVSVLAVTGSSGSGKTPKDETHHPVRNHNMKSYKIASHQHIPEIIQTLGIAENMLAFAPASGPFTRGIHLTAFVDLKKKMTADEIGGLFEKTYSQALFVRLKKNVQLADVVGSNYCDVALHCTDGKFIVQAVSDNLVKGAAGNAIQNMNLMHGFDEGAGLANLSPLFP